MSEDEFIIRFRKLTLPLFSTIGYFRDLRIHCYSGISEIQIMKKFNKDDFKKHRDQYPLIQRIILAILIAVAIGLATASNAVAFAATTDQVTTQSVKSNGATKNSASRFGVIDPDVLPSGNTLVKTSTNNNLFVKVAGSLLALFTIGVSLFNFDPKKVSSKKADLIK